MLTLVSLLFTLGVLITLAIVFLTGVFATNFFGAKLVTLWHDLLHRIPVVDDSRVVWGLGSTDDTPASPAKPNW